MATFETATRYTVTVRNQQGASSVSYHPSRAAAKRYLRATWFDLERMTTTVVDNRTGWSIYDGSAKGF